MTINVCCSEGGPISKGAVKNSFLQRDCKWRVRGSVLQDKGVCDDETIYCAHLGQIVPPQMIKAIYAVC